MVSPSCGYSATPMLEVTHSGVPATDSGAASATEMRSCSACRSARMRGDVSSTRNSSLPQRASTSVPCRVWRRRCDRATSSSSPAAWPRVSFTSLKWSRLMSSSAASIDWARASSIARAKRWVKCARLGRPVSTSCSDWKLARSSVCLMALMSASLTSTASWPVMASLQRRADSSCQRSPWGVRTASVSVATPCCSRLRDRAANAVGLPMRSCSRSPGLCTTARAAGLRYSASPFWP